ncbi:MAG: hypothetical protein ACE149_14785 [Armatimonadota bacterium]
MLTRHPIRWPDVPLASRRIADEVERIGFGRILCQLDADLQPKWSPPPRVKRGRNIRRPEVGAAPPRDLDAIPRGEFLVMLDVFASGEPGDWVNIIVQDRLPVHVEIDEWAKS